MFDRFYTISQTLPTPLFWRIWILLLLLTLLAVSGINCLINPFSMYRTNLFEPFRPNSYILKAEQFESLEPKPQAIIIGSSRAGSVDPEVVNELTGLECYNWSVPSAGIEATEAIIHLAVEEYHAPLELVIITVDPEFFHPGLGIHAQAWLAPMYTPYFSEVSFRTRIITFMDKTQRLITIEQLNSSIDVIKRTLGDESIPTIDLYRDDGFALYIFRKEAIAAGTFDLDARITERLQSYPDDKLCFSRYLEIPEDRFQDFRRILEYCNNNGINVYAYLPPAHPRYIEMLIEFGSDQVLSHISGVLSTMLPAFGGVFRDYTDLDSFGGDPEQFYDEVHGRKSNNDLILQDLLAHYPDETPPGIH